MNKVSVIIPIFNVEKFLCRALDSLLVQSHQDWEAIMVDDGSTDHSVSIAQQYLEKDKRFILITQENQGQAVARPTVFPAGMTGESNRRPRNFWR